MANWKKVVLATGTSSQYIKGDGSFATDIDSLPLTGGTLTGDILINNSTPSLTLQDSDGSNQKLEILHSGANTFFTSRNGSSNGAFFFRSYNGSAFSTALQLDSSQNATFSGHVTIGSGGTTPDLIFDQGDSQITGPLNANFLIKSRGNSADEGVSIQGADGVGLLINKAGNATFGGDVTVSGGDMTLTGATTSIIGEQTAGANRGKIKFVTSFGDGDIVFETTTNGAGAITEAMRIAHDGAIGIGHNAPEQLLHLKSEAPFMAFTDTSNNSESGVLYRNTSGTNVGFAIYDFSNNALKFRTNNSLALTIGSDQSAIFSGNVSIGMPVSQMSKTLHVQSNTGSAGTPNGLMLTNTVHGSDSQIYMYAEDDSGTQSSGVIKFDPDLKRMKLIGSGNVGLYVDHTGHTNFESNANLADDLALSLGSSTDAQLFVSSSDGHTYFRNNTSSADIIFKVRIGSTDSEVLRLDGATGNATFSGKVGIGIDSPSHTLHLAATEPYIKFQGTHTDGLYLIGTGDGNLYFTDGSTGVPTMTMDDNLIGIGTSSPSYKLDITGPATENGSTLRLNDAVASKNSKHLLLTRASSTASIGIAGSQANDPLWISRSGGYDLMVASGGNIGIGTSVPLGTLHIKRASNVPNLPVSSQLHLSLGGAGTSNGYVGIGFGFAGVGTAYRPAMITYKTTQNGGNQAGELGFWTRNTTTGSDAPTQRMVITDGGDVGIGATPLRHFSIADDNSFSNSNGHISMSVSPSVSLNENAGIAFGTFNDDDYWKQGIFWKRTGSYGLGELHFAVRSTADSTTVSIADSALRIESNKTATFSGEVKSTTNITSNSGGVGKVSLATSGNHAVIDMNNSTPSHTVRIHAGGDTFFNGGNVGIGETNPNTKLSLKGSQGALDFTRGNTNDSHWFFSSDSARLYISETDIQSSNIKVTISDSGKVGIGTSQPDKTLHLASSDNVLATIESTTTHATVRLIDPDTSNQATLTRVGDNLEIVKDGGNVSIGKDNPAQALDVEGSIISSGVLLAPTYVTFNHSFYDDIGTTAHYLPWGNLAEATGNDSSATSFLVPMSMTLKKLFIRIESITNIGNHNLTVTLISKADGTISNTTVASATQSFSAASSNKTVTYVESDFSATPRLTQKQLGSLKIQFGSDYGSQTDFFVTSVWQMNNNTL